MGRLGLMLVLSVLPRAVLAQAPVAVEAAEPERVVISASGAALRIFDAPFAVGTVDAAQLRAAGPMANLSEALARVPGLVVANRQNYAQDLQISSRGFGARSSFGVRGLRLYSDGIPASGPDGQGQVASFDLAGAARIEVLRGPFSALYGSSSGGVIALVSAAAESRSAGLDLDRGSDGLSQWRARIAAPLEGGFNLRASVSLFDTDGPRPHSAARRTLANLRLGWEGADDRVTVLLNSINQPAQDPLGLTREQLAADPRQTATQALQFDTRKETSQAQWGASWLHRVDVAGLDSTRLVAWSGNRSVTQWQAIAPAAQAAPLHPGGVIDFSRRYDGADLRATATLAAVKLVFGAAIERQREDRRGFENFIGSGAQQQLGVTGRLRRDELDRAETRDLFAQGELALGEQWQASAGLRRGRLRVGARDAFLSNGDDSGALAFGYTTPVAALRWQPGDEWSLHASAGRGFEAPTLGELAYRPDGASGLNTALRPQRSRQVELGLKWRPRGGGASVELALFEARTSDEIGVQTNSGGRSTFSNVGATLRRGAELQASWRPAAAWRLQTALTWLDASYRDPFLTCAGTPCAAPTLPVAPGNRIAGTVRSQAFAEVAWTAAPGTELALEVRGQGPQPVNDRNSDRAAGYGALGVRVQQVMMLERARIELLARLDDLVNRRVAGSVIVAEGNQRFFEPTPGRTWLLGARCAWPF